MPLYGDSPIIRIRWVTIFYRSIKVRLFPNSLTSELEIPYTAVSRYELANTKGKHYLRIYVDASAVSEANEASLQQQSQSSVHPTLSRGFLEFTSIYIDTIQELERATRALTTPQS